MGYCGPMGYGVQIPAHRVGGSEKLWVIRGMGYEGFDCITKNYV